jgi:hypothetical protein
VSTIEGNAVGQETNEFAAIGFIYAAFFSADFSKSSTQLWTTFTGLAFAIGGTVTEFLGCCIFLFVKHPYDVGDRVDITQVELVVVRISLMYTVFRRVDSDKVVQIPHNVANTLWIENVSRSKAMKERLTLNVAATTSIDDIEALRSELHKFVTSSEHKRDFQPEFDIELIGVGDMKQLELRVEIQHKVCFLPHFARSMQSKCLTQSLFSLTLPTNHCALTAAINSCASCSLACAVYLSSLRAVLLYPWATHSTHTTPSPYQTTSPLPRVQSMMTKWMRRGCSPRRPVSSTLSLLRYSLLSEMSQLL